MKAVNLGGEFYIPENRILHVFPYNSSVGKKIVASVKANNNDGTRIYDCSGRRKKSSVIVIEGGKSGDHIVLSPLTPKTIVKKRAADTEPY